MRYWGSAFKSGWISYLLFSCFGCFFWRGTLVKLYSNSLDFFEGISRQQLPIHTGFSHWTTKLGPWEAIYEVRILYTMRPWRFFPVTRQYRSTLVRTVRCHAGKVFMLPLILVICLSTRQKRRVLGWWIWDTLGYLGLLPPRPFSLEETIQESLADHAKNLCGMSFDRLWVMSPQIIFVTITSTMSDHPWTNIRTVLFLGPHTIINGDSAVNKDQTISCIDLLLDSKLWWCSSRFVA